MIRVQTEAFSVEQEMMALNAGMRTVGATVVFVGTVRELSADRQVSSIEIEHYPGMTERELARIETAARQAFALEGLVVIHRVGRLMAQEPIVLILAAAAHRHAAFDACRFVIDQIKQTVPLWKKEFIMDTRHDDTAQSTWHGLRVGLLTMSDSRTKATDQSGAQVESFVNTQGGTVVLRDLITDNEGEIREILREWIDLHGIDLILTIGGTGPSPRDVTPEATRALCGREMPGVAELMRQAGLPHVRTAALSRGIVALRHATLVINLPGSPEGALQSIHAVADLVPHILHMAHGGSHGSSSHSLES